MSKKNKVLKFIVSLNCKQLFVAIKSNNFNINQTFFNRKKLSNICFKAFCENCYEKESKLEVLH